MTRFPSASLIAAALLAAFALPGAALADAPTDYNLFVLGKIDVHSGDIEGRAAAGGNASFQSYSVGGSAPAGAVNLVVGGNLTAKNGSTNGLTVVGGSTSYTGWSNAGLQLPGTPLPVDFMAAATFLTQRALDLSSYAATGTVASPYTNQFVLTGAANGLSVFNLSADAIKNSNSFTINLAPGTKALINVTGAAASLSGGLVINGGSASDVLWNFYDAGTLSFSGIDMLGSVLAPNADYLGGWGQLHGTLMVKSFSDARGSTELHNDGLYNGGLLTVPPAVPEPASWAMMIAGFGLVGATLRRRRSAPVLA